MADDDRSLGQLVSDTRSQVAKGKSDRKKSVGSAISGGLRDLSSTEKDAADRAASNIHAVSYHKGGVIRKAGLKRLEKGERVIARGKRKRVDRLMKRSGMRMKARR